MKLYKKSERKIQTSILIKSFKENGFHVSHMGEWDKWKEIYDGRLQVKMDVYEIRNDLMTAYLMSDTLGRVAAPLTEDKQEVLNWLNDKGYKPDKQWYLEDYGMSEDAWEEWNQ